MYNGNTFTWIAYVDMVHTIDKKDIVAENGASIERDSIISQSKNDIEHELKDRNIGDMIFDLKNREKNGTIYKYMGVERFRKILLNTVGLLNTKKSDAGRPLKLYSLKSYDQESLERELHLGKRAESTHIIGTILCLTSTIGLMATNNDPNWIILFGFLLNFYAMILQRYKRGRITSLLEKRKEHDERKETLIDTLQ